MQIRNYTPNDLDACRSLWAELVQRHRDIYGDQTIGGDNPELEFDKHLALADLENIWIAESEGIVIGFTSLIKKGEEAEIEPIVVSHTHRGRGVGELLIKHAVEEAKKSNILCVYVKPVARNIEAISFFYDCGFKNLGHIQLFKWLGEETPETWQEGVKLFGKTFTY